jgi:thioredoxin 1
MIIVNKDNFAEITEKWIVLIDFWAEWCWPCKQMLSILDMFIEKNWDKVTVWKIDVDEEPELAKQFRVMSIPTLIFFKDWNLVETLVWVQDLAKLEETIWKYL